jgi:hypothetical protein
LSYMVRSPGVSSTVGTPLPSGERRGQESDTSRRADRTGDPSGEKELVLTPAGMEGQSQQKNRGKCRGVEGRCP